MLVRHLVILAALGTMLACSDAVSSATPDGAPGDAAPADAMLDANRSVGSTDGGTSECNDLAASARVAIVAEATASPPPRGGEIAGGVYVLSRATLYTEPGGASGETDRFKRMSVRKTGATLDLVFDEGTGEVRRSFSVEESGTSLMLTTKCGGKGKGDTAYTATPTTLMLYSRTGGGTQVDVLEKR